MDENSPPITAEQLVEFGKNLNQACLAEPAPNDDADGLRPRIKGHSMESEHHTRRLVEVVVAPTSRVIGRQLSELPLPDSPYRGGSDPQVALAVVFAARAIMANLITNAASAVFMYPIALSMAGQLGISFMPFAIALMTGTVGSLITPSAYQTNLMVYEPGNYTFRDFMGAGIALTILVGIVTVILAPMAFAF